MYLLIHNFGFIKLMYIIIQHTRRVKKKDYYSVDDAYRSKAAFNNGVLNLIYFLGMACLPRSIGLPILPYKRARPST